MTQDAKKYLDYEGLIKVFDLIKKELNGKSLPFWVGTQEEFDAIETKENGIFYCIEENNE